MTDDQEQKPDATEEQAATADAGTETDTETSFDFGADPDTGQAEARNEPEAPSGGLPTYEELEASVAELKDQLLRALAETENTRRRAEREKADATKYSTANLARAILGVADNLGRALASVSEEAKEADEELKNLCVGIELTETEMVNAFKQFSINPIDAMGKKFDHNFHQAVFEVEDPDQPTGTVVQEVQRGYVIHDRLLRPSMVGVTKGGPKAALEETDAPTDIGGEDASPEEAAASPASAYEKQSEAADRVSDKSESHVDKKL